MCKGWGFQGSMERRGEKVHMPHSSSTTPRSSSNIHALAPLASCHSSILRKSSEGKWEQVQGFYVQKCTIRSKLKIHTELKICKGSTNSGYSTTRRSTKPPP